MGQAGPTGSAGQSQDQRAGRRYLDRDLVSELTGTRKEASPRLE